MATSTISRKGLGTPTTIDLNSNWTAPSDGIVNVVVGWNNNASYGYCYIKDKTTDTYVCMISNAGALGGFSVNSMFPTVKGHQYKIDALNQVGSVVNTFYAV